MNTHNHDIGTNLSSSVGTTYLKIILSTVLVVMIVEVIGGLLSGSLALLSDAGHMLVDALAMGIALFAMTLAKRPATTTKTFGYHRVEIIAALANGIILALVSIYIFYQAYQRFLNPTPVQADLMLLVAGIGLVINLIGIVLLRKISNGNLNIKAAFWHIIGDTVSSVGVIIGGIIILITGWYFADTIIGVFTGGIILWGAVRIVRESIDIIMETIPKDIELSSVIDTLKSVSGVKNVHDIHIWSIASGRNAFSAHLCIEDQTVSNSEEILTMINQKLISHFNISHTTIQLECDSCPTGIYCPLSNY